jgi:hypothetical protein
MHIVAYGVAMGPTTKTTAMSRARYEGCLAGRLRDWRAGLFMHRSYYHSNNQRFNNNNFCRTCRFCSYPEARIRSRISSAMFQPLDGGTMATKCRYPSDRHRHLSLFVYHPARDSSRALFRKDPFRFVSRALSSRFVPFRDHCRYAPIRFVSMRFVSFRTVSFRFVSYYFLLICWGDPRFAARIHGRQAFHDSMRQKCHDRASL